MKAIALDGDPAVLKQLEQYCGKVDFVDLQKTFLRPADLLVYLESHSADLLFLDPGSMQEDVGWADRLPEGLRLIVTGEEAVPGYRFPEDTEFLMRPFRFEPFARALTRVSEAIAASERQHLFVRADYRLFRLPLEEIIYIEGLDDYLKIHLERGRPLVARMTMKAVLEKLPPDDFLRIHRSYIVPLRRIREVSGKTVSVNGCRLPVGASYSETVASRLGSAERGQ